MSVTEDAVREALKVVLDPELFINIVDLGLVYVVTIQENEAEQSAVAIEMTFTSPMCPSGPRMVTQAKQAVMQLPGVAAVDVKVVMSPPWSPDCMTEEARDQLGIF